MRLEVLLHDAEIVSLKVIQSGAAPDVTAREFHERRAQLIADFAFMAEYNIGGEFMKPKRIEQIDHVDVAKYLG